MSTQLFIITAQTNLHVGSGDSNYGIIDNLVQRDVLTELPHIHASSLKGALREYYEEVIGDKVKAVSIFGSDPTNKEKDKAQKGSHNFFEAHLLVMPVASNVGNFFRATTKERIANLINISKNMGGSITAENVAALKLITNMSVNRNHPIVFSEDLSGFQGEVFLGDFKADKQSSIAYPKTILGDRLAIFHEDDFKILCDNEHLPVIARNQLENGVSKNLWYEQIVPRESRFFMLLQQPNNTFSEAIKGKVIQVGANATVGYGYCTFNTL